MAGIHFNILDDRIIFTGFRDESQAFEQHDRVTWIWRENKELFPEVTAMGFRRGQNGFSVIFDPNINIERATQVAQRFLTRILQN